MKKRVFISSGEASGDLHAAGLISELKKLNPDLDFWGLGGDRLASQGVEILFHISRLSTMGFAEVVRRLPFFRRVFKAVIRRFESERPDAAILVDYPGMNFRFAERLNDLGIPFVYYILPQVWAWHKSRIEKMKRWNAKFISILPFEPKFYAEHGLDVEFFGHPLVDLAKTDILPEDFRQSLNIESGEKLIALLPGSRTQEIDRILPVMLSGLEPVCQEFRNIRAVCRPADRSQNSIYARIIDASGAGAEIYNGALYSLLTAADLTLVTSGTATVETAICNSPAIVLYRTNPLTYMIAKRLVTINNIAMANIIAGETVYPELIQGNASPRKLTSEILRFLRDGKYSDSIRFKISKVSMLLGEKGAYKRAARRALSLLFK